MSQPPSVEARLLRLLILIAAVAVLGVLALVPYRLYSRDVRHAEVQAHRLASVANAALGQAVARGEDVRDLANRFQGIADFEIRLRRLQPGDLEPTATSSRGRSELDGTELTYTGTPIVGSDGTTWLATMYFDLSPMRRESVRLIVDLVVAVVLGAALFSAVVYLLIRRALVNPLRDVTRRIEDLAEGRVPGSLREFETREMAALAVAVERVCGPGANADV